MSNDRTGLIKIRVSTEEKARFAELAGRGGVTISTLIRETVLGDDGSVRHRRVKSEVTEPAAKSEASDSAPPKSLTKEESWRQADEDYRRLQEEKHGPLV